MRSDNVGLKMWESVRVRPSPKNVGAIAFLNSGTITFELPWPVCMKLCEVMGSRGSFKT